VPPWSGELVPGRCRRHGARLDKPFRAAGARVVITPRGLMVTRGRPVRDSALRKKAGAPWGIHQPPVEKWPLRGRLIGSSLKRTVAV